MVEALFNQYVGNLQADILSGATSAIVAPVPVGPAATDHWRVLIRSEWFKVTHTTDNMDGTATLTIVGAQEGSSAANHGKGSQVRSVLTAAAVGNLLTVEELDGSPSLEGVRKLVLPNGTVGVSGTTATYTPASSAFTAAGDSGSSQTISPGDTLTIAGGEGLASVASATDTVTVKLNIPELTADASPDGAADYVVTYDDSASAHKKVLLNDLPGGGGGGSAFCGASVYNNGSDQTLPATTNTLLIWSTATGTITAYDTDALFDVMDPTKLTVPVGKTGRWQVGGSVDIYGSDPGSGNRKVDIKVNGSNKLTPFLHHNVNAPDEECYTFNWVFNLTAGDYVELNFYNASAVDLFLSNGAGSSVFEMTFLGA